MSISIIRTALETRLLNWASSHNPPISTALQGYVFEKPTKGFWIEPFLMPATRFDRNVGANKYTDIGLFEVRVWGLMGRSTVEIEAIAEEIVALFPTVPKGVVSIEKTPKVGRVELDPSGWQCVSVLISYRYES